MKPEYLDIDPVPYSEHKNKSECMQYVSKSDYDKLMAFTRELAVDKIAYGYYDPVPGSPNFQCQECRATADKKEGIAHKENCFIRTCEIWLKENPA